MTRDKYFTALSKEDRPVGVANVMARYIKSLEATIEAQEIIIKDKSAYMEAMEKHKYEFIDTSCIRCKNVNDCSLCENVKNETGMKLREMSFVCFEPKVQL